MAKYVDNIRVFDSIIDLPPMDSAAEAEIIKATVMGWIKDAKNITEALQAIEVYGAEIVMSAFSPNHYAISPKPGSLLSAVKKRGGSRPGAGRPPISDEKRTPRAIRLTDAEYDKVKEFLQTIR